MNRPRQEPPPIVAGKVTVSQTEPGLIVLTHKGKNGDTKATIDASKLERWVMRTLREEAFA